MALAGRDFQAAVELWKPDPGSAGGDIEMLAELLHATVHRGASVSFLLPFSIEEARSFWRGRVLPDIVSGGTRMIVARAGGRIVGTVQLELA